MAPTRASAKQSPALDLADTRKARMLDANGKYSRPRAVRNGHGFSVQEHFMRIASGFSDSPRTSTLLEPLVVYTANGVKAAPASSPDQSEAQESANATV